MHGHAAVGVRSCPVPADTQMRWAATELTGKMEVHSVLDQAADRDGTDMAGNRNSLRQGDADVDQR